MNADAATARSLRTAGTFTVYALSLRSDKFDSVVVGATSLLLLYGIELQQQRQPHRRLQHQRRGRDTTRPTPGRSPCSDHYTHTVNNFDFDLEATKSLNVCQLFHYRMSSNHSGARRAYHDINTCIVTTQSTTASPPRPLRALQNYMSCDHPDHHGAQHSLITRRPCSAAQLHPSISTSTPSSATTAASDLDLLLQRLLQPALPHGYSASLHQLHLESTTSSSPATPSSPSSYFIIIAASNTKSTTSTSSQHYFVDGGRVVHAE